MQRPAALYARDHSLPEYLDYLRHAHPALHDLLNHERYLDFERYVATMNMTSWEFEDESVGGRGAAYNSAQRRGDNRVRGMTSLLGCFGAFEDSGPAFKILDVLGGDGTFARFCRTLGPHTPTIYTADISRFMIDACVAQGLPCVRQAATRSLFRDNVLDGVLIAYGSHHLDTPARRQAVREVYRTLRRGGRLVLHDFEIGGASARWFDTVVHPYSRTGHPHSHFSRHEMRELLAGVGFREVEVFEIDDSFTLHGSSAELARHHALVHMHDMYDLIKLADAAGDALPRLEQLITETLGPISIRAGGGGYVAEITRRALVAVGTKP